MARTSTFPLIDRLLDGRLSETLTAWRTEGLSFETMARRLATEHDVEVSTATVHRWCNEQGIDAALTPVEPDREAS